MRRSPVIGGATFAALFVITMLMAPLARADVDNVTMMQMSDMLQQAQRGSAIPLPSGPTANQQISEARDAYWKAYVKGPVPKEIEERFFKLLCDKDLALMHSLFIQDDADQVAKELGVDRPDDQPDVGDLMRMLVKAEVDGGVRPTAVSEFLRWHDKVAERRRKLSPEINLVTAGPAAAMAMFQSINQRDPELLAYLKARDDAEKLAVLDRLPKRSPREYLLTYLELSGEDRAQAEQWLAELEQFAGAQRVEQAASSLQSEPKDRHGLFANPVLEDADGDELRLNTRERMDRLVAHGDPRLYAIWLIRDEQRVDWAKAKEIYEKEWVAAFGEPAVLEAAKKVRTSPKNVRLSREGLVHEIAGARRPAAALAALMPHDPYRDRPLGSLGSRDPYKYLFALLKEYAGAEHWSAARNGVQDLLTEWGEPALIESAQRLIEAPKDAQGRLTSPRNLGVSSANPWDALHELLNQTIERPGKYFAHLARNASSPRVIEAGYEHLVASFGKEKVESVIAQVREAMQQNSDLARLKGNVSGARAPLPAIHELLWSAATPDQYLHYLLNDGKVRDRYFERFGRETTLKMADRLRTAPRQPDSIAQALSSPGSALIADPNRLGLESVARGGSQTTVQGALNQLLIQEEQRLAALPLEDGQQLEHKNRMRGYAVVLRHFETKNGWQYLLNENGRCTWQPHDTLRQWFKPVSGVDAQIRPAPEPRPLINAMWGEGSEVLAYVDGKMCEGTILFYEGRSQPPTWAVEYAPADKPRQTEIDLFSGNQLRERPISAEEYPVGSKVRLKMGRRIVSGVVSAFDEQHGRISIEIDAGRRPQKIQINSRRMIEQYDLQLVTAAPKAQ